MMDLDVLVTGGVGVVTTFISGFTSYIFTRKKYNTEVDSNRLDNLQKSLEFYEKNQLLNNKIIADVKKDNEELRKENKALKIQVDKYEDIIKSLHDQNDALSERVSKLESLVSKLNKVKKNGNTTKKDSKKA